MSHVCSFTNFTKNTYIIIALSGWIIKFYNGCSCSNAVKLFTGAGQPTIPFGVLLHACLLDLPKIPAVSSNDSFLSFLQLLTWYIVQLCLGQRTVGLVFETVQKEQ